MAAKKQAQVIITANASVAERVMQELDGAAQRAANQMKSLASQSTNLKERMRQLEAEGKKDTDEFKALKEQLKQVEKQYKSAEKEFQAFNSRMRENVKDTKRVQEVMKDLAGTATRDLRRALQAAKRELDKMSAKDPNRQQLVSDMKKIQAQIEANTGAIKKQQGMWGALGTTMKNLFAYAGIFAAFNRLKGLMEDIVQKNREMSDQLANIRKVSGLAMSDINELTKRLAKIDTRSSIQELNELAYVGSKLGFGTIGGIDALEGFVNSALKVNNALKEDLGEDSMMAISKLVEVMGLIPKMGVEKAMDSAGSAIFKLASTSTATGANIIEFSKRLMGLANVSHITTDQLLALGSASDAMGLMPEVSATAFNKVFTSIQSNTKAIEQSLNMQKGELTALINEGKTMEAIVTVFDKMHGMNMDELKAKGVFKALGSDGARLNNVMITMSDRIDMLKTHLKTSNQAFTEGTAVAQEYAIQMDTAEAYMQRASNMFTKAFVNPEGVDLTKEFAKAWYDFAKALTEGNGNAIAIQITLKSLFGILKLVVEMLPAIISGFAAWGFWAGGAFLITQLKQIGTLISTIGAGIKAMSLAGLAGIFTGVAVAAYTLFQHFRELNGELEKNRGFMDGFKKDLGDLNKQFGASTDELKRYKNAIDQSVQGTKQRAAAIAEFNNKFGGYLKNMLTEESSAYAIAKAYDTVTKALRAKLALQLKEKDIQDQVITREAWTAERREEYANTVKGTQYSQYGRDWITAFAEENKGRKIGDIGKDLAKMFGISNKEVQNMLPFLNQSQTQNRALYTDQQWMVRSALRYIAQDRSARNAKIAVDQKWAPEQKAMDEYLASQAPKETPITPIDGDRLTKEELRELKKQQQEEKKHLRKELEDAEKESTAVINAIEEFYRLQESAIEQLVADGKMTREEADRTIDYIRNRKDQMLLEARRAITGNANNFTELRKTMDKDLLRPTDTASLRAKETVQTVDVNAAAAKLKKFDGSAGVYDLNSGSFTQSVLKNAAQNELNIQRRQAAMATEMDKLLMQYEYVEQAQRSFGDKLVKLGLITEGYDKVVQQLADGTEIVANTKDVQALSEKVVGMDTRIFNVDMDDALELRNMIDALTSTVDEDGKKIRESFASMFPDLNQWMAEPEQFKEAMQAFYRSLLDYDTAYYNARKQNYELYKKQNQQMWAETGRGEEYDQIYTQLQNQQTQQDVFGTGQTFGQQYGLADAIANDPEVELYKQKLQAAAEYYQFVESHQHTEQELREAGQATLEAFMAMAKKVGNEVAERAAKIQELQQPVTDFAEEAGQKLGDMLFNMESQSMTWNQIIKKMILSFAQMTVKMAAENLTKKIQQALFYKQMQAMEIEHQTTMLGIQTAFGAMQIGAQQSINTTKQVAQTADNTATVAKEVSLATILTSLGISEGAAKTIGALGWWGIPLVAVISSLLLGLLASALSTAGSKSAATSSTSSSATKVKLVSGMLTYDEGNVQNYVGQDGHVYRAREAGQIPEGVSIVKQPIATTVNGQPSLVAEKGPEIVIGRRTTARIMMNEPRLLHHLATLGNGRSYGGYRGLRTFDEGNLGDIVGGGRNNGITSSRNNEEINAALERNAAALEQNAAAMAAFSQMMAAIQQQGIPATVQQFGKGSLDEGMRSVTAFRRRYPVG